MYINIYFLKLFGNYILIIELLIIDFMITLYELLTKMFIFRMKI